MELTFKKIVQYVLGELPKEERKQVWNEMKRETVHLEDAESVEKLQEKHKFDSSSELLEWVNETNAPAIAKFKEFANGELKKAKFVDKQKSL